VGEITYLKHQRGGDKTVVGSLIAAKLGQPTLIVVTKNDLTVAWKQALNQILGIPLSMIGQVQQDMCDWKGKQFVIGMLHSLIIEDRYPEEMYRHFGLMIVDEVHLVAAEHFQEICWKVPAKHRIGFSATPTRKDGRDRLLKAHIGETLVKGYLVPMKPKVLVKKTGWQIPMYRDRETMGLVKIPHQPGRMMGVVKAQANNQNRNLLILEFVLATFKNGRRTVIMADTLDHLDRLFQIFTSGGISGDKIGFYVGQMSQADLDFNKEKPVILATYRMVSTGTNVPKWDTLVLATPRSDVKQMIGRVLRFLTDKKQPVILDLLDDDKLLHNFHLSRLRQYYAVGAEIVYV
jgi:superfamily II DNA or RNA helicase